MRASRTCRVAEHAAWPAAFSGHDIDAARLRASSLAREDAGAAQFAGRQCGASAGLRRCARDGRAARFSSAPAESTAERAVRWRRGFRRAGTDRFTGCRRDEAPRRALRALHSPALAAHALGHARRSLVARPAARSPPVDAQCHAPPWPRQHNAAHTLPHREMMPDTHRRRGFAIGHWSRLSASQALAQRAPLYRQGAEHATIPRR